MSIQMKNIQFPSASYDEWKEQAIKALKGKPFQSLFTETIEGVTLEPLYTQEMLMDKLGDNLEKQISTIRSLKDSAGFKISQQVYGETSSQFFTLLQESVERGNDCVTIHSRVPFKWDEENLTLLAKYLAENTFKLFIENEKDPILNVFNKINAPSVKGFIISHQGNMLSNFENVRSISINTIPYHHDGASVIEELAISLALAAKYAEQEGSYEKMISKSFVSFAIDTQFFLEIAKLRAFKVLWKAFSKAYKVDKPAAIPVMAETSLRSYTKADPYVNLLRAGNEAFAALIGGADYFTVHPHDCLTKPTEKSIRIARNVSLVLKEESFVENVLDASGGSYFIETLTADYAEKAWELFLEIEKAGGIDAYTQSGQLQARLDRLFESRLDAVQTRKDSLIGTNIYANPADEVPAETNPQFAQIKRLAIPFEKLRVNYKEFKPRIAILTYGKLKDFKPRADFVDGFFATVGIVPEKSGEITNIEAAKDWMEQANYDYVVIAAKDEDTKLLLPSILELQPKGILVDVAGKYKQEQEEWLEKGLNGFIYAGQNIVEKLTEVLESLKGVQQ
ncbi:methylmalonyl-CoA mutase family protein [Ureibacillus aquaedulcis]|uniref:Methylmalonyl-CoA mutase family protein n=1 Tax=Ureibacillus aquaedulcis TaxID=3058421 RepID=A0ABT8GPN5_9BACL|nr:methylmalonyl-CoA mutase family protein [Ureibacillus sp. BA0131]MDN4493385.1 methylmalonyl-CoA mutase family protein [Ureibacillus sp. BA0131]